MDDFEDLLLSITEPYDKKRRKQIESEIHTDPGANQTAKLTEEEEEKKFYQYLISVFTPERRMTQARVKGINYLDISGRKYTIRRPYKDPNWAIYENGSFMVRIQMKQKDEYHFKVDQSVFSCLNLSDEIADLIKERMSAKGNYVYFVLNYDNACELVDDFNNASRKKRNSLLDEKERIPNHDQIKNSSKTKEKTNINNIHFNQKETIAKKTWRPLTEEEEIARGWKPHREIVTKSSNKTINVDDMISIKYKGKLYTSLSNLCNEFGIEAKDVKHWEKKFGGDLKRAIDYCIKFFSLKAIDD